MNSCKRSHKEKEFNSVRSARYSNHRDKDLVNDTTPGVNHSLRYGWQETQLMDKDKDKKKKNNFFSRFFSGIGGKKVVIKQINTERFFRITNSKDAQKALLETRRRFIISWVVKGGSIKVFIEDNDDLQAVRKSLNRF